MKYHNFEESLMRSKVDSDLPIWEEIFKKAFPDMIDGGYHDHKQDGEHQRKGIDCSIILLNSKQILIDKKARYKNEKTGKIYDDILLEFWSDFEKQKPGWVCKPLLSDYIAYAILPLGICYLLPVIQLQQAWKRNQEKWRMEYGPPIIAENEYNGHKWKTISIAIPPNILFKEIGQCLRIKFEPLNNKQKDLHEQKELF